MDNESNAGNSIENQVDEREIAVWAARCFALGTTVPEPERDETVPEREVRMVRRGAHQLNQAWETLAQIYPQDRWIWGEIDRGRNMVAAAETWIADPNNRIGKPITLKRDFSSTGY